MGKLIEDHLTRLCVHQDDAHPSRPIQILVDAFLPKPLKTRGDGFVRRPRR
jgi:hypothetical protein